MKILVMGAGAIGAFYGAWLQKAGEEVYYCARGEHLRAMQEHGLEVKSVEGDFKLAVKAASDPKQFAPYDLVLFCVKSYDTVTAAGQLQGSLAPDGVLLTLQNGVENEAALCTIFPRESVMGGNARVGAEIPAPGKLIHTAGKMVEFGELDGADTPRAHRLAEMFRRAGVLGELTHDLLTIRWDKLMGNNGTNTVCTLGRCSLGAAIADPDGFQTIRRLMVETVMVGRAEGARMTEDRADLLLANLKRIPHLDQVRPSTLQDYERGKRLEYDAITGAVIRAARRHGIDVPVTETVHALLKLLDQGIEATRARGAQSSAR